MAVVCHPSVFWARDRVGYDRQVHLDQYYNTRVGASNMLPSSERQPISIYEVLIPRIETRAFSVWQETTGSHFLQTNLMSEKHLHLYYKHHNDAKRAAQIWNGKLSQILIGTKLLSHNTYLVRNPSSSRAFTIKFMREDLDSEQVRKAVEVSEILRRITQTERPSTFDYMPEPGAVLAPNGYHFSLREQSPPNFNGEDLIPLHALLGRDEEGRRPEIYLMALAASGLSEMEWGREFLFKFGQFLAETNLRYGIFSEAHPQNVLVKLNEFGRIVRFIFRDLRDLVLDEAILMAKGVNVPLWKQKFPMAFLPLPWQGTIHSLYGNEFSYAGLFNATFANQIVLAVDAIAYPERPKIMVDGYLDQATRMFGSKFTKYPVVNRAGWPKEYAQLQIIYDQVLLERFGINLQKLTRKPKDEVKLKAALESSQILYTQSDGRGNLESYLNSSSAKYLNVGANYYQKHKTIFSDDLPTEQMFGEVAFYRKKNGTLVVLDRVTNSILGLVPEWCAEMLQEESTLKK